jgi:hypothetical protein
LEEDEIVTVRSTIREVLLDPKYGLEARFREDLAKQDQEINDTIEDGVPYTSNADDEWQDSVDHTDPLKYMDRIHILALSVISNLPILVLGKAVVDFAANGYITRSNIPGIYASHLPNMHESTSTLYLAPIPIAFHASHFTTIVPAAGEHTADIPLTFSNSTPFLDHFTDTQREVQVDHKYIRTSNSNGTPTVKIYAPHTQTTALTLLSILGKFEPNKGVVSPLGTPEYTTSGDQDIEQIELKEEVIFDEEGVFYRSSKQEHNRAEDQRSGKMESNRSESPRRGQHSSRIRYGRNNERERNVRQPTNRDRTSEDAQRNSEPVERQSRASGERSREVSGQGASSSRGHHDSEMTR